MFTLETVTPKRILVVRSLPGLGDLICSVPALRALRLAYPSAQISFLGLPNQRWFCDRFARFVDHWVDFPGYPGIPEGWQGAEAIPGFLTEQQVKDYDLALQLHGNGSYINPLVTLIGAKITAGFFVPGQFCPDPRYFFPYPHTEPEIWRLLRLLELLQIPLQGDHLEFPLQPEDYAAYSQQTQLCNLHAGTYVCIHPGASGRDRRWSVSGFASVADDLSRRGYTVVLTGTASERSLTQAIAEQMSTQSLNLAGQTELGVLALLLHHSALLVCNDTGVSHLAAATQTPSVVIFSHSETYRWAPLNRDRHRVVDLQILDAPPLDAVLAEIDSVLKQPSEHVREEVAYAR